MQFAPAATELNGLIAPYSEALLNGDRNAARAVISQAIVDGLDSAEILVDIVYRTMESIQNAYRENRIARVALHMATRLNRAIADQISSQLGREESNGRRVVVMCGNAEPEELGGQICADLFEAAGFDVRFCGGGVPDDEIHTLLGHFRPDLLVMFATLPQQVPTARKLIDYIRDMNTCPGLQFLCAGGIFNRARGLAEEIGADLFAPDPAAAVISAETHRFRRATPSQQTVGRRRHRRAAATNTRVDAVIARIAPLRKAG